MSTPDRDRLAELLDKLKELQEEKWSVLTAADDEVRAIEHDLLATQAKIDDIHARAGSRPARLFERLTRSGAIAASAGPLPTVAPQPNLALVTPAAQTPQRPLRTPRIHLHKAPGGHNGGHHRQVESNHPFPRAVGVVKDWAKKHGLHYSAVKSWYAETATWKPIPRKWAIVLNREYGVPLKAWRGREVNGVFRPGITDDVRGGRTRHRDIPRAEIAARRAAGAKVIDLAREYNIDRNTVRVIVKEAAAAAHKGMTP